MYDVVFVGGGIVSLIAAYKYQKNNPDKKHVVLEKQARVGGRAFNKIFCGKEVNLGAGVGRYEKDKELLSILQELKIPYKVYPKKISYFNLKGDKFVVSCIKKIKEAKSETFRESGIRILGEKTYEDFLDSAGYTDFEKADTKDVLENYGLDDLIKGGSIFGFSWSLLIKKLSSNLNIIYNCNVTSIMNNIVYSSNGTFKYKDVYVGLTAKPLQKLFPGFFKDLSGQPFLRIYANLNKQLPISNYTVVGRPLQKIIPMGDNLYMIAYSDNDSALLLKKKGLKTLEMMLQDLFNDKSIKINKILKHFWEEGTHYWLPNSKRHMPTGIHFIGEAVNNNQGWTGPSIYVINK